jgi:L-Ala-D/L-Glu epimerase
MKIEHLSLHCLSIPFVQAFQHATQDRRTSDAIIVEVRSGDHRGYGEALAREYVTGESTRSVVAHLTEQVWPRLAGAELAVGSPSSLLEAVAGCLAAAAPQAFMPPESGTGLIAHNAARCGIELALVDCWLKTQRRSLGAVLPARQQEVSYSGVISAGSVERAVALARKMLLGGLRQIKIKVGDELDEQRVAAVREAVGPECSLRVDANGAWDFDIALSKLAALARQNIESCEEPLGRARRADLPRLVAHSPIPIMVDESLITDADAEQLLEQRGCHAFNLRLSKLGGLLPCLRLARRAEQRGVWCQLGSHVGETSILAAAGRHLALHLGQLRFLEGSFGSLLLSVDIASPSIKFGHGGRAGALRGDGLGAAVLPDRLRELSVESWSSA